MDPVCKIHGSSPKRGWRIFKSKTRAICGDCEVERKERWYAKHSEYAKQRSRQILATVKLETMAAYCGGIPKCALCDEDDIDYLCLDHENGDGAQHRRTANVAKGRIYSWCKKNNFPSGLRVLCHNCNMREWRRMHGLGKSRSAMKNRRLKLQTLKHYGNGTADCSICGESDIDVLALDHVDGGGAKDRSNRGVSSGYPFYRRLRQERFPPGFRVLCCSCNMKESFKKLRTMDDPS